MVFNVWDLDEDGKCWSELNATGDRRDPRNDIPNLMRSLGEIPTISEEEDLIQYFDPTYQGQFDLAAFLKGMATYYRDNQKDDGDRKVMGTKGKTEVFWRTETERERNELIRDNFFTHFEQGIMQAAHVESALVSKGDPLTPAEVESLMTQRNQVGAKKGQVSIPRRDDGTIDLSAMYETLIEGIDCALDNPSPMNETPKTINTEFTSPAPRPMTDYQGNSYNLKS